MDDIKKDVIAERLKILFKGETQEETAEKLGYHQPDVHRWLKGQCITFDLLANISRKYSVSVDWLMGLSDVKKKNGLDFAHLTFEQLVRFIFVLLNKGIVEHPDLSDYTGIKLRENNGSPLTNEFVSDEDFEDSDDRLTEENQLVSTPDIDTNYLKINDCALAFLLRRRRLLLGVGPDIFMEWQEKLNAFDDIRLLDETSNEKEYLETKPIATYNKDADWVEALKDVIAKSEEERAALIELRNKREA